MEDRNIPTITSNVNGPNTQINYLIPPFFNGSIIALDYFEIMAVESCKECDK